MARRKLAEGCEEMTKEQFLKRCETIYDKGYFKNRNISSMLRHSADTFMRLRSVYANNPAMFEEINKGHQGNIACDALEYNLDTKRTLANDNDLYEALNIACILDHPCQFCAEDPEAWHTRYGFCNHHLA